VYLDLGDLGFVRVGRRSGSQVVVLVKGDPSFAAIFEEGTIVVGTLPFLVRSLVKRCPSITGLSWFFFRPGTNVTVVGMIAIMICIRLSIYTSSSVSHH